jgi:hypothetical protein
MGMQISSERRRAFYLGTGLMVLGGLLFLSTLVTWGLNFGDFTDFERRSRSGFMRAVLGMVLLFVGSLLRGAGARGLAGSGVLLDPARARRELEPYSRMAGGMVKDALSELRPPAAEQATPPRVKVRCRACSSLSPETAKFCQECGQAL